MDKHLFYKAKLDLRSIKKKFEYLKYHYVSYTLNSWNDLKSIAHNVKLYNLGLDGDWQNALSHLYDNEWCKVNNMIYEWESKHAGYQVGFNGRSGGYLVLYTKKHNGNILPKYLTNNDNYEDFKEWVLNYYSEKLSGIKNDLNFYVNLVRDFDKLCDKLRKYCNKLSLIPIKEEE